MIDMGKKLKVKVEFFEELLGTASADPDIHYNFIAKNAPDAPSRKEEIEALGVDEVADRGTTVFPRLENGQPFLWDYQWKGYLKDAAGGLRTIKGTESSKVKAYKKLIDKLIYPQPRKVALNLPAGKAIDFCERPLRASTAQGERVALASSEACPAGTTAEFEILVLDEGLVPFVKELLEFGELRGHGQWRNSGKGRFTCEIEEM